MVTIELRSDNAAGVLPEVLDALTTANEGSALAYGGDDLTRRLESLVREVFEHPTAAVFPVTSGTAANALALSAMCPPWGAVVCHESAHVLRSECGATSLLGGGATVRGLPGDDARLSADGLGAWLDTVGWGDPHQSQPAVLSLTEPTDRGTVYASDDLAALAEVAHRRSMRVHVDGARIANALAALDRSPAELTWRAGVDVLSLGAIKNGGLSAEAIVAFDERAAAELVYRTKRAGHVTSKMRFQSAQLLAHLTDGRWLRSAAHANRRAAELAHGLDELGVELVERPDVNLLFVRVADPVARRLVEGGLRFYPMGDDVIRLVTSWQTTVADVETALAVFGDAVAPQA